MYFCALAVSWKICLAKILLIAEADQPFRDCWVIFIPSFGFVCTYAYILR